MADVVGVVAEKEMVEVIRVSVSNNEDDDFLRRRVRLRASSDTKTVVWSIPDRLVTSAAMPIILDELLAEVKQ